MIGIIRIYFVLVNLEDPVTFLARGLKKQGHIARLACSKILKSLFGSVLGADGGFQKSLEDSQSRKLETGKNQKRTH